MQIEYKNGDTIIKDIGPFSLAQTLECGQVFHWRAAGGGAFEGASEGRHLNIRQKGGELILGGCGKEAAEFWVRYFDLNRDYGELHKRLRADTVLRDAIDYCGGIRILRQPAWETTLAFIISQNNNIKRISGIVLRLCEQFGQELAPGVFSFPPPVRLCGLEPDDLAAIRSGFRARYLIDAARRVALGEVDFSKLRGDINSAKHTLMQVTGIGSKVADCILLFGLGYDQCVPIDVWMKRVMSVLYPAGMPDCAKGIEGIAQQYLFHYIRNHPQVLDNPEINETV